MKILFALSLLGCLPAAAQTTAPVRKEVKTVTAAKNSADSADIFVFVEQMPQSTVNITAYMASHIQYPAGAGDLSGRVIVKFIVNEDGSLSNVQAVRGISKELDEEVVRAVKGMPAWTPGRQNGKVVKVWFTLPVNIHPQ